MKEMRCSGDALTPSDFSSGVVASTLTPFSEDGAILLDAVTDQARRLSRIRGVLGIAVNTTIRERQSLTCAERIEVVARTRLALGQGQILLACVGALCEAVEEEIAAVAEAGADAVIIFLPSWREGADAPAFGDHLSHLVGLTDRLPLPVIAAMGESQQRRNGDCPEIATLARDSRKVIGVDMGRHDNVLHYDQAYYALKAVDRPLACLPSSEAALFHNLNTGADGALSCLAYLAPHEVAALYQATSAGLIHEARALHNRLAPLIGLISDQDKVTREMILRQTAHRRGLLASADARGVLEPLASHLAASIERTLDDIALQPVQWV